MHLGALDLQGRPEVFLAVERLPRVLPHPVLSFLLPLSTASLGRSLTVITTFMLLRFRLQLFLPSLILSLLLPLLLLLLILPLR